MPNAISFFPWVSLAKPLTVGSVRLIPYIRGRGRSPGDLPYVRKDEIDSVLRAYSLRKNRVVRNATLLEVADWQLGQPVERYVTKLFHARELIAFSAIAARRLFSATGHYCNLDTYSLVVQHYQDGSPGTFSFTMDRRDGSTTHLWDSKEFSFVKPLHVPDDASVNLDIALLAALLDASGKDLAPLEAITEFNRANTDSQNVPAHVELVLTKSAFEYLLDIGHDANEFASAVTRFVSDGESSRECDRHIAPAWSTRWPKAVSPLDAWAREFCAVRGGAAHGQQRSAGNFVWSEHSHLAFASILFPLMVKKRLQNVGLLEPEELDGIHLERVSAYLAVDPFQRSADGRRIKEHPWRRIYREDVLGELSSRRLRRHMDEIDFGKIGTDR